MNLTVVFDREDDGYVSFCPELDIASQGKNIPEARDNIREALELFLNAPLRKKRSAVSGVPYRFKHSTVSVDNSQSVYNRMLLEQTL